MELLPHWKAKFIAEALKKAMADIAAGEQQRLAGERSLALKTAAREKCYAEWASEAKNENSHRLFGRQSS